MSASSAPRVDSRHAAVRAARDPDAVRSRLQAWFESRGRPERVESLALQYLNYLPGQDFCAVYEATLRRGEHTEPALLFGNIRYEDDALELVAKAERRARNGAYATPRIGEAAYHLPDLGMVIWTYPNDPKLQALRPALEPEAVRAALGRLGGPDGSRNGGWEVGAFDRRLVRYIPRKRVLFRYEIEWRRERGADGGPRADPSSTLSSVYAKLYEDAGTAGEAHAVLEVLWRAALADARALRVPRPLHLDAQNQVLYQSVLPGEVLSRAAESVTPARAAEIGRGLALLQQTRLVLRSTLELEGEFSKVGQAARLVAVVHPEFAAALAEIEARLGARLSALPRLPLVPCHGTFKLAHLPYGASRIGLVDFDSMVLADPVYDVANFVANLHYLELIGALPEGRAERLGRAFHDAWCALVPWGRRDAVLDWYVAGLLVRKQAFKLVKHMHADADATIRRVLDVARRRLGV